MTTDNATELRPRCFPLTHRWMWRETEGLWNVFVCANCGQIKRVSSHG